MTLNKSIICPMKNARYPLPWWLITDAPSLRVAPGGVYRAVLSLAFAYWASGCVTMPEDDVSLSAMCRLPISTWRQCKGDVGHAMAQITPALTLEWQKAHKAAEGRRAQQQRLTAIHAARRGQRQVAAQAAQPAYTHSSRGPASQAAAFSARPRVASVASRTGDTFTD
jgi:hypothetical protein